MTDDARPATDAAGTGARWARWWQRHKRAFALLFFGAGLASFLLIERQEKVAQAMVVVLPAAWIAMLAEGWVQRLAASSRRLRLSPLVLRYTLQGLHQESFFFTLPFFVATTTWASGQAAFTGLLALAALGSIVDPFYFGPLAHRRWAYLAFHALAVFVTVLTAAPMLWHLTTLDSLQLAIFCMVVLSVPSMAAAIERPGWWHALTLLAAAFALGGAAWLARAWIPPATLWVTQAVVSQHVSAETKSAEPLPHELTAAEVHAGGVAVWTAIRAPRGLAERIEHVWRHEGETIDRIELEIHGGREQGYRAWTHKRSFPADPRGDWQVRVETEAGQLIGVVRFRVR